MSVLTKFLKKIGVERYEDLNNEEKETFKKWEESLSGRSITQEDYRLFIQSELQEAISRLTETNLPIETAAFRKAEVKFCQKVLAFLDAPKVEKQLLEKQLEAQL